MGAYTMNEVNSESFYVTVGGTKVFYKPMSFVKQGKIKQGLELDYRERGEPLDTPKVEVAVFGDETIEVDLSEANIEVEDNPEETARRKELWAAHIDALGRLKKDLKEAENNQLFKAILTQLPEDESWIAEQKALHIRVPEDPEKRRQHYIETEVLTSMEDIVEINSLIFTKSAVRTVGAEDLAVAKDSFRDIVLGTLKGSTTADNGIEAAEDTAKE
jgi:hypothetical protein